MKKRISKYDTIIPGAEIRSIVLRWKLSFTACLILPEIVVKTVENKELAIVKAIISFSETPILYKMGGKIKT